MNSVRQASRPLVVPRRGEIWWVGLDPAEGSEMQKTRPCVVVSTDALARLPLRVVVPLTGWRPSHRGRPYTVPIPRDGANRLEKDSSADPLQVRCVSVARFRSIIGRMDGAQLYDIVTALALVVEAM